MSNFLPNRLMRRLQGMSLDLPIDQEASSPFCSSPSLVGIHPTKDKDNSFIDAIPVPWSNLGFYLPSSYPRDFFLGYAAAGALFPIQASSLFISVLLRQLEGLSRDVKAMYVASTAEADLMAPISLTLGAQSMLLLHLSTELAPFLAAQQISRLGFAHSVLSQSDSSLLATLAPLFDLLVVQGPQQRAAVAQQVTEISALQQLIPEISLLQIAQQQRLVQHSLAALSAGGYFVYQSFGEAPALHAAVVDWLIDDMGMSVVVLPQDSLAPSTIGYTSRQGQYFQVDNDPTAHSFCYYSVFQKPKDLSHDSKGYPSSKADPSRSHPLAERLSLPDGLAVYSDNGDEFIFPRAYLDVLERIGDILPILIKGTPLYENWGDGLRYSRAVAQSLYLKESAWTIDVGIEAALEYLRTEGLAKENWINLSEGDYQVRFNRLGLGWFRVKL